MSDLLEQLLEQSKRQTKQLGYQTKLLEAMVEALDAGQKKGLKDAMLMKTQTIDLLSNLMGNHPMLNKLKKDMGQGDDNGV